MLTLSNKRSALSNNLKILPRKQFNNAMISSLIFYGSRLCFQWRHSSLCIVNLTSLTCQRVHKVRKMAARGAEYNAQSRNEWLDSVTGQIFIFWVNFSKIWADFFLGVIFYFSGQKTEN